MKGFGEALEKLMKKDKTVVLIVPDTGWSLYPDFKKLFPDRCFDFGICEQTIIGMAAGMALVGLKPYVYGITPFLMERPFEQVKLDIVANNVNVKLIGYWNRTDWGITHYTKDIKKLCKLQGIKYQEALTSEDIHKILKKDYLINKPSFTLLLS